MRRAEEPNKPKEVEWSIELLRMAREGSRKVISRGGLLGLAYGMREMVGDVENPSTVLIRVRRAPQRRDEVVCEDRALQRALFLRQLVGAARGVVRLAAALRRQGLFVPPIRPPSVPEGTARLRVSVTAGHSEEDIHRLVAALRANMCHISSKNTPWSTSPR